jgi:ketosteroid isomerase-like protein
MKHLQAWAILGLISLAGAAAAQAPQSGATEKAIVALENQWLKSEQTNNADLIAPLIADKFIGTGADGSVMNKAQGLADQKATKYTSAAYENVQVTVFGDTAIATGLFNAKGTDSSGKPLDDHDRWTDTWVKMPDGKWQCVASHSSHVKS